MYDWHDEPGVSYEAHAHKDKVTVYIVEGGVLFRFGEAEIPLVAGARFDVPIGQTHTAVVGPDGCTYVVGEMIERDS